MTDFEKQVLEAVIKKAGSRARYLDVRAWVCDVSIALHHLEKMGLVKSKLYRDAGNNECYDRWYPVNKEGV